MTSSFGGTEEDLPGSFGRTQEVLGNPLLSLRSVAKAKGPYVSAEVHSFEVSPESQLK